MTYGGGGVAGREIRTNHYAKVKDAMENITLPFWKRAMAVALTGTLAFTLCPATALADEGVAESQPGAETVDPTFDAAVTVEEAAVAAVADQPQADDPATTPDQPATPGTGEEANPGTTPETPNPGTTPGGSTNTEGDKKPEAPKPQPKPKPVLSFKTASKLAGAKWQKAAVSTKTLKSKAMGKTVSTKPLTAVRIYNNSKNISGSVKYSVYMKGKGWSKTASNGKTAGNGKTKNAVQAMKISLSGELGKQYNVYYRVYVTGLGWTGWGRNGAKVGAPKLADVKAYQVKLVKKSNKKTNKSYNSKKNRKSALVTTKSGTEMKNRLAMAAKAQGQKSSTKWLILVDTHKNRVEILKGQKGDWKVHKYWKCTSGASGSRTVRGKFTIQSRGLYFGNEKGYTCWYWTQFYGNYLFHSVLYNVGSKSSIQDGRLGINASHGCVRLALGNAKWINRNIPSGTRVWSY